MLVVEISVMIDRANQRRFQQYCAYFINLGGVLELHSCKGNNKNKQEVFVQKMPIQKYLRISDAI